MLNITFEIIAELMVLLMALSIDAFIASFAYGVSAIKIPWSSILILAGVSSVVLALSASLGLLIKNFIPDEYIKVLCFVLLLIPGVIKLFDSFIKSLIRRKNGVNSQLNFKLLNLHFMLKVYADPDVADIDRSKVLTAKEAVSLSLALSLDSLAVGIGASMTTFNFWLAIPVSFLFGIFAVAIGSCLGNKTQAVVKTDLSWISGVMLIGLAIMKLF